MPKEEKEIKKKKEEKGDWWSRLPSNLKVIGIAITAFLFYQSQQTGEPIQWLWIGLCWLILYLQAKEKPVEEIMNESLARKLVKDKFKEYISNGDLPTGTDTWVDENGDIKYSEAIPSYYLFGALLRFPNGERIYKQAKVYIKTWDVLIQDSVGKITGREPVPTKKIIPEFINVLKKYPELGKSEVLRFLGR